MTQKQSKKGKEREPPTMQDTYSLAGVTVVWYQEAGGMAQGVLLRGVSNRLGTTSRLCHRHYAELPSVRLTDDSDGNHWRWR